MVLAAVALVFAGCGSSDDDTYVVREDPGAPRHRTPLVGEELVDASPERCAELRSELEELVEDLGVAFDAVLEQKADYDAGRVDDVSTFDEAWLGDFEATKWQLDTMETCPEITTARAVAIRTWRDIGKFQNAFVAQTQTRDPLPSISAEQVGSNLDELHGLLGLPRGAS